MCSAALKSSWLFLTSWFIKYSLALTASPSDPDLEGWKIQPEISPVRASREPERICVGLRSASGSGPLSRRIKAATGRSGKRSDFPHLLELWKTPLPMSAALPWASSLSARRLGESPPMPGTQQEHGSSLSCATLNFFRGRKGRRKIKNSPVMWRAESPPEDSWHNNLNDQMIQRRLVSAETAS